MPSGRSCVGPKAAAVLFPGGSSHVKQCVSLIRSMPRTANALDRKSILGRVARECGRVLQDNRGQFACMKSVEDGLGFPRVRSSFIRFWFGRRMHFPDANLLADVVEHGAPVHVSGTGDLQAALSYGNHRSVLPYMPVILDKIYDDVRYGRTFIFPRELASSIHGLRNSPLGVVVNPSKTRVINDLSHQTSDKGRCVNIDKDVAEAPCVELGHVLREVVERILYLRRRFGPRVRIVISKADIASAYRHVPVAWSGAPVFGFVFGDWVAVDRRLCFGWRSSPAWFSLFSRAIEFSHRHTSASTAVVSEHGRNATAHVKVECPAANVPNVPLPPGCRTPAGEGGGPGDLFWCGTYSDDTICVAVHWSDAHCLLASGSVAADHFRLLGASGPDDPPVLAQHKVTSWSTMQCVLGWEIDTVAGTIGVPDDKLDRARSLLEQQWPSCRRFASETELRSLVGTLLHLSTIVRVGRFFLRRMLNTVGLPPKPVWGRSKPIIRLGPEFHADVQFWKMLLSGGAQSRVHFTIPLYRFVPQPPAYLLWSDACGSAFGGYFCIPEKEEGVWARYDLTPAERARFQQERAESHDDLSINVLELFGMVLMAWVFVREEKMQPRHGHDCLLMRGDNSSACSWVAKCRGGKEPRSGALMRILGCLEFTSGWCFESLHVKGEDNNFIADGISRWERNSIESRLRVARPDIRWREQVLGPAAVALCADILAASTSVDQLRTRLGRVTSGASGLGTNFVG